MKAPFMRIPYTGQLPPPVIIPHSASTAPGAVAAIANFLDAPKSTHLKHHHSRSNQTVLLTGAGISVASGLADYRGANGTYTLNKQYRPIYFNEFVASHEARKRYWARSFLGWTNLHRSSPNPAHYAVKKLGDLSYVSSVITQNVDSFHAKAHPDLQTLELHGYLRSLVCLSCRQEFSRETFQEQLSRLNPAWADFLEDMLQSGALTTENPDERRKRGLKANPDGDVDVPDAPYTTFRYPPCPVCLHDPPTLLDGSKVSVQVDQDGAWHHSSNGGILKPAVIMFGESISASTKLAAEQAIHEASRILVIGSSLATYSAWRLVKLAKESCMPIAILNLGGVRGEAAFFEHVNSEGSGSEGLRCSQGAEDILPQLAAQLKGFEAKL